jgi:hypothetical protein
MNYERASKINIFTVYSVFLRAFNLQKKKISEYQTIKAAFCDFL